ncbi:hypothetical protein [Legionella sp. WA2022007384]
MEFLRELVKSYTQEYGDAIFIKGVVTSTTKDSDGNYIGLTALISAKIDLDKLPEDLSRESVIISDANVVEMDNSFFGNLIAKNNPTLNYHSLSTVK